MNLGRNMGNLILDKNHLLMVFKGCDGKEISVSEKRGDRKKGLDVQRQNRRPGQGEKEWKSQDEGRGGEEITGPPLEQGALRSQRNQTKDKVDKER